LKGRKKNIFRVNAKIGGEDVIKRQYYSWRKGGFREKGKVGSLHLLTRKDRGTKGKGRAKVSAKLHILFYE